MKKYLQIIKITFEEYFEYRLNFVLWRFRSFVSFLTLLFFWLAIYGTKTNLFNYQKSQILAYVIGVAFLRSIVLGSRSIDLGGQIKSGELTKLLIRPLNMLSFWFTRDLADKTLNLFFTILEVWLVLTIFNTPFYFPKYASSYFWFLVSVILAFFLYFFINFIISVATFWVDEIWSTRWLFGIIFLEFFAGAFFPVDVLPRWLVRIIYLTPFPYLIFFPLKIWLEQLSFGVLVSAVGVCLGWLITAWWLARFLWNKGIKVYGAFGN